MTNSQKTSLTIDTITITGTDSGDFTETGTTCAQLLLSKQSCTITITFAPKAKGARTATLKITDSAATSPQSSKLTGTGQ
jgi:hypothetical protein